MMQAALRAVATGRGAAAAAGAGAAAAPATAHARVAAPQHGAPAGAGSPGSDSTIAGLLGSYVDVFGGPIDRAEVDSALSDLQAGRLAFEDATAAGAGAGPSAAAYTVQEPGDAASTDAGSGFTDALLEVAEPAPPAARQGSTQGSLASVVHDLLADPEVGAAIQRRILAHPEFIRAARQHGSVLPPAAHPLALTVGDEADERGEDALAVLLRGLFAGLRDVGTAVGEAFAALGTGLRRVIEDVAAALEGRPRAARRSPWLPPRNAPRALQVNEIVKVVVAVAAVVLLKRCVRLGVRLGVCLGGIRAVV